MSKRCVIIGASPECDAVTVAEQVGKEDFVVCADGGYVYAVQAGIQPDLIVGDFDSSVFPENMECETVVLPVRKDDTDVMYCVRECVKRGCSEVILLGVTGGRCDHTYANYCILLYLARRHIRAKIIDSENEIFVLCPAESARIEGMYGHTFSIFPFGCGKCTVTLKGFEYSLEKGVLNTEFPLGVSNVIQYFNAEITVHDGSALCILNK